MAVLKQLLTGIVMCCALQTQAQLSKGKDNAESLYNQAVQETKQEHYDKAISLSKQTLEKQPDFIRQTAKPSPSSGAVRMPANR